MNSYGGSPPQGEDAPVTTGGLPRWHTHLPLGCLVCKVHQRSQVHYKQCLGS